MVAPRVAHTSRPGSGSSAGPEWSRIAILPQRSETGNKYLF